MSFWETVTGSDLTREYRALEVRAGKLPADHRAGWEKIKGHLFSYADFSGRNLIPILDGALGLLEETAAEGRGADEVLGEDVEVLCAALADSKQARSVHDRWRDQVNRNVARKLGRLGG